jgi:phosphate transport system protein
MRMTRSTFEEQLATLRNRLLAMGSAADNMVGMAMQALVEQDVELAAEVIAADDTIDGLDVEIETECMRLIALQTPVARDLHLVGTVLKAITDIERIGDHAVDIAKVARKLATESFYKPMVDLPKMANAVRQMLRDAMTAFVNHDLDVVNEVVAADDEVDSHFHRIRDELHGVMRHDPNLVVQASYLLFVAHYLERIADHIVNIAERVHYAETGELAQLARTHKTAS